LEEINQAYKDLVFVWHPDRIPQDNERLYQKAQDKIKALNQARDVLRTHSRNGHSSSSSATNRYGSASRSPSSTYYSASQASSRASCRVWTPAWLSTWANQRHQQVSSYTTPPTSISRPSMVGMIDFGEVPTAFVIGVQEEQAIGPSWAKR
jgi:curved DNA-binding protein CbpA